MSRKTPTILTAVVAVLATAAPFAQGQAQAAATVQLSYATRTNGRLQIHGVDSTAGREHAELGRLARRAGVVATDVQHTVRASTMDPLLPQQTDLQQVDGPAVWSYPDAHGAVVAVVDSGVDGTHPDLRGRVLQGAEFLDPDRETSSGNGWNDQFSHGTGVAGIIGAGVNDGVGMAGLARGVRILPVRVLGPDGTGSDVNVARGITWAVDHGATVVNLSLGDSHHSTMEEQAVAYATAHNVLVVAAAGNEGDTGNPVIYPAALPDVVAVGAYDGNRNRASFSEHGAFVDLAAPGVGTLVTTPGGRYAIGEGTSFAAPFVAATAALMRGNEPRLSAAAVRRTLEQTATDLGPAGRDDDFGAGSVDPVAALSRVGVRPAASATLSAPSSVIVGDSLTVRATVRSATSRPALLQRATGSRWSTLAQVAPDWMGRVAFTATAPRSGRTVTYRVVAAGASAARTVALRPVPPRTVATTVAGRTASRVVTVGITVGGGRSQAGVPVTLSYQSPGSQTWSTAGTWATGGDGRLTVTMSLGGGGTWRFRSSADGVTSPVVAAA